MYEVATTDAIEVYIRSVGTLVCADNMCDPYRKINAVLELRAQV